MRCKSFSIKNIFCLVLALTLILELAQTASAALNDASKTTGSSLLKRTRVERKNYEKKIGESNLGAPTNQQIVNFPSQQISNTAGGAKVLRQPRHVGAIQKLGSNLASGFKKMGQGIRSFAAGIKTKVNNFMGAGSSGLKPVSVGVDQRAFKEKDNIDVFEPFRK